MPHESQNEIAFDALRDFLLQIGFDRSFEVNSSMAFHHEESGTIITVSIPAEGQHVRSADLLSIAMRLEAQGLVGESELEQFRSGKLPMAS